MNGEEPACILCNAGHGYDQRGNNTTNLATNYSFTGHIAVVGETRTEGYDPLPQLFVEKVMKVDVNADIRMQAVIAVTLKPEL